MFVTYEKNPLTISRQKSGLVVSVLDSWLEGCGFESCPILDGNGVKAMPGLITAPNSGSFHNWKERKYK